jgi:hypothetical protein
MKAKLRYRFESVTEKLFRVSVTQPDGRVRSVGTVEHVYVKHLKQHAWEATGPDGHLAMHAMKLQAAFALTWDRRGYPFPVHPAHIRDMIIDD